MATIVNQPPQPQVQSDNGLNTLATVLLLIVAGFLLFYYGLPAMRRATNYAGPNISIPRQIDVNINQPTGE